jgi:hypothetical protein
MSWRLPLVLQNMPFAARAATHAVADYDFLCPVVTRPPAPGVPWSHVLLPSFARNQTMFAMHVPGTIM